jgi:long-chain fatty acid transport protein
MPGNVTLPLPATLSLATDVDIIEGTNIEFVYERAFWSTYKELDITVDATGLGGPLTHIQSDKNWEDSNTFRLGLTQSLGDSVDLMVGIAYDQTPVPEETLGFELPDSDAILGSVGARWAVNEELDVGAAILYDQKQSRTVDQGNPTAPGDVNIQGEFTGASALIVSVGLGYKF